MSLLPSGAIETTGYDINNSLRFRSSVTAYLNRTPTVAGNRRTFTYSAWVKIGTISTWKKMFSVWNANTDAGYFDFGINNNNTFTIQGWNTAWRISTQVFRDPSAWYHIVVAIDTTQATAANRIKLYVNGNQVTSFSSSSDPTQNYDFLLNSTVATYIGTDSSSIGASNFDGYMTDINFIDGQALTPSSFGETDAVTGVWKAKKYTGSYGTNGFYLPFTNANTSSHAGSFNGSSQGLTFTPTSNIVFGSNDYTVEAWVNFNSIGAGTQVIYQSGSSGTNNFYLSCQSGFVGVGTQAVYVSQQTTTLTANKWYHIVACRASGTLRLFVNGTQIGSSVTDSTSWLASGTASLGYAQYVSGQYLNGSISNVRVVNGTGLYTSNFVPPSSPLTAVTNTQLLTLQNSSIVDTSANAYTITNVGSVTTSASYPFAANISSDRSGNANNWITNNIQVATPSATTYDAMSDVPTLTSATVANYCTLNPLRNTAASNGTFSNANLRVTGVNGVTNCIAAGTMTISGKMYWEITVTTIATASTAGVGIVLESSNQITTAGNMTTGIYYLGNGNKRVTGTSSAYGSSYTSGDVIGIAVDTSAETITFYKNNVSQGSISGTGVISLGVLPFIGMDDINSPSVTANFGQRPFAYTPPTGYKALNTYNLPDSTIKKGNTVMDATLYTGDGASSRAITNAASFRPDFVWIKQRSSTEQHQAFDSIRGATKVLNPNLTNAESTDVTKLTAFNSDGFSIGSELAVNRSGYTYVGWQWQAGSSTVTNTSGSISSQVRANTTAGFSVVTYSGNGASGATVGHGLGVAPKMMIVKCRTSGTNSWTSWQVYHASLTNPATSFVRLNETSAAYTGFASAWNSTAPTLSVFSISYAGGAGVNGSGDTFVAYCWAEIAGYSKFGSYTGNGSTDGPFVYLGFRPKFILYKASGLAESWMIYDTSRNPSNVTNLALAPQSSSAEFETTSINRAMDILSNGFKPRGSDGNINSSGATYIYAAFAESPFKSSLAR